MTQKTHNETFDRLLQAFLHHDQRALEELAQEGVPVDLRDARGHTVLLRAAALGDAAAVEWILQAGAEVDGTESSACSASEANTGECTAFLLAAEQGHLRTVETLLASGANPNRVDGEGRSALMLAAHQGHLETVRFLVRSGVDLDLESHQGHSALSLVQNAGHQEIVSLLQALGASGGASTEPLTSGGPTPGGPTSGGPAPENSASEHQMADLEWQMPSTPKVFQARSRSTSSAEDSTADPFNDHIADQISDWVEDEAIDF